MQKFDSTAPRRANLIPVSKLPTQPMVEAEPWTLLEAAEIFPASQPIAQNPRHDRPQPIYSRNQITVNYTVNNHSGNSSYVSTSATSVRWSRRGSRHRQSSSMQWLPVMMVTLGILLLFMSAVQLLQTSQTILHLQLEQDQRLTQLEQEQEE